MAKRKKTKKVTKAKREVSKPTKKSGTTRKPSPKNKGGRPAKFKKVYEGVVKALAIKGFTDKEIGAAFNVATKTIDNWKDKYPGFLRSLKAGKEIADNQVVRSLFQRATGYSHPDVHISNHKGDITVTPIIKHYAPDTTACIFWLKNRDKDNWRDRHEHTGADGEPLLPIQVIIKNGKVQD